MLFVLVLVLLLACAPVHNVFAVCVGGVYVATVVASATGVLAAVVVVAILTHVNFATYVACVAAIVA